MVTDHTKSFRELGVILALAAASSSLLALGLLRRAASVPMPVGNFLRWVQVLNRRQGARNVHTSYCARHIPANRASCVSASTLPMESVQAKAE